MLDNLKELKIEELKREVLELKNKGYRYVTSTCTHLSDGTFDIVYHFDKDYQIINLRINVEENQKVPSISDIYFSAVLVENEIKDLYKIDFDGMLIDYEGKFIITEDLDAPMRRDVNVNLKKGE